MRFIAFDLETTGTLPGIDRIVEIGAVRFINNEIDGVFSTLVNPQIPIPEAASRVNGITDEMLVGQPSIDQLLKPFADFCADDLLIAHNAPFDTQFLSADILRFEAHSPKGLILDTYAIAKKVLPGLANYRLGTLVQHLNIPSTGFHRAEEDASYCGQLFIRLAQKISGSPHQWPPLENLMTLSNRGALRFPQVVPQPKQLSLF